MPILDQLSTDQIRQALQLSEQIDLLQQRLNGILGGTESTAQNKPGKAGATSGKRTMSAEGRERIAAAARARWAEAKGGTVKAPKGTAKTAAKESAPKKKGGLTEEGRAKLAAAMKARWAARKKGAPAPNAAK